MTADISSSAPASTGSAARPADTGRPAAPAPISPEIRAELVAVARDVLEHSRNGTLRTTDDVMTVPAANYTDPAHFGAELERMFRRIPVVVALSCEVSKAGDQRPIEIAGVPVLVVRGRDGAARVFLNACTHRGSMLARECTTATRITCPYHGWAFDDRGALVGISGRQDFGPIDTDQYGLRELPALERGGFIWAVLDPNSKVDIDTFLGSFGSMLERFGFEHWHLIDRRELPGANWKLAFDAHMEFYHLPVLHRGTFGADTSAKALYFHFGPHQRLVPPGRRAIRVAPIEGDLWSQTEWPEEEWTEEALMLGEWILYPNISINTFYRGGRSVIISQILPGPTVDTSITVQIYLMENEPTDETRAEAITMFDFLGQVVGGEDLPQSIAQQRALAPGLLPSVVFGRNEGGLHEFHRWTERIIGAASDAELDALFSRSSR